MPDQIMQGLQISLIGMGLTFFSLVILVLIMILLDRLFRSNGRASASEIRSGLQAKGSVVPKERDALEEEIAVAIAVALACLGLQVADRGSLGDTLAEEKGAWWRRGGSASLMRRIIRRQNVDV